MWNLTRGKATNKEKNNKSKHKTIIKRRKPRNLHHNKSQISWMKKLLKRKRLRGGSRSTATSKMERFVAIALHLGCCNSPRSASASSKEESEAEPAVIPSRSNSKRKRQDKTNLQPDDSLRQIKSNRSKIQSFS